MCFGCFGVVLDGPRAAAPPWRGPARQACRLLFAARSCSRCCALLGAPGCTIVLCWFVLIVAAACGAHVPLRRGGGGRPLPAGLYHCYFLAHCWERKRGLGEGGAWTLAAFQGRAPGGPARAGAPGARAVRALHKCAVVPRQALFLGVGGGRGFIPVGVDLHCFLAASLAAWGCWAGLSATPLHQASCSCSSCSCWRGMGCALGARHWRGAAAAPAAVSGWTARAVLHHRQGYVDAFKCSRPRLSPSLVSLSHTHAEALLHSITCRGRTRSNAGPPRSHRNRPTWP